ncbi:MAG: hypothetical protein DRP87_10045 [Spirochaetes bacterium]|nr:MAG: hypothetical protein DRP87_10045 [Spirochaetota bacterium]
MLRYLECYVKTGTAKAREIIRARIFLLTDGSCRSKGKTDPDIAEELDVCLRTVGATRERCLAGDLKPGGDPSASSYRFLGLTCRLMQRVSPLSKIMTKQRNLRA